MSAPADGPRPPLFVRACRAEPVERTPIWIMRQAGRYLPEYRAVRERVGFLELCKSPDLAAEVSLQPVRRFGLDACILFSDILLPAEPMGLELRFGPAPVLEPPVRTAQDVARLRPVDVEASLGFVYEAIRLLRRELGGRLPVIGFAAAPFTFAAYLVEGRGSKSFARIRGLLHADPATAHRLLVRVSDVLADHLAAQVRAGAQAVQLFDTWAGWLGQEDFETFALAYANRVLERLAGLGAVPRIYFALGAAHLLPVLRQSRAEVLGVDWRVGLDRASAQLEHRFVLQGNLDPARLLGHPGELVAAARRVLEAGRVAPGHIFNLGHGILPQTPVAQVQRLVEAVQREAVPGTGGAGG